MKRFSLAAIFLIFIIKIQAQYDLHKVSPSLLNALSSNKTTDFLVVLKKQADLSAVASFTTKEQKADFVFNTLKKTAEESQKNIQLFLHAENIDFQSFWIVNGIYAKGDFNIVKTLAMREDVAQITANPKAETQYFKENTPILQARGEKTIEWGLSKIKADSVWGLGYRGQGVVIGGQDTGYDWQHPIIKPKYRGWNSTLSQSDHNYNWHDAIHLPVDTLKRTNPCGYDTQAPCDDNSHGTHTMGTMVGSNDTMFIGVAPEARWICARNMDRGNGTLQSYVECFQWFLAPTDLQNKNPNPKLAPHVINNSWYCSTNEGCNETNFAILEQAMNNLRASGVVVVVSVGNSGPACSSADGPPGFFEKAFSIGATQISDTIAGFSSRGPVKIDNSNRLKPNVSAPGSSVRSSTPNGNFASYSGTSMAGPHVAGLVALMISANPKLAGQVDTIESIIEQTAKPMFTEQECGDIKGSVSPNNTYGYGRVDALAAVKKALDFKLVSPTQNIDNQSIVKFYPNPFNDNLTILTEGVTGTVDLKIFNINGQIVFNKKDNFNEKNVLTISLKDIPIGLYFYQIKNDNKQLSGKIVKQ